MSWSPRSRRLRLPRCLPPGGIIWRQAPRWPSLTGRPPRSPLREPRRTWPAPRQSCRPAPGQAARGNRGDRGRAGLGARAGRRGPTDGPAACQPGGQGQHHPNAARGCRDGRRNSGGAGGRDRGRPERGEAAGPPTCHRRRRGAARGREGRTRPGRLGAVEAQPDGARRGDRLRHHPHGGRDRRPGAAGALVPAGWRGEAAALHARGIPAAIAVGSALASVATAARTALRRRSPMSPMPRNSRRR